MTYKDIPGGEPITAGQAELLIAAVKASKDGIPFSYQIGGRPNCVIGHVAAAVGVSAEALWTWGSRSIGSVVDLNLRGSRLLLPAAPLPILETLQSWYDRDDASQFDGYDAVGGNDRPDMCAVIRGWVREEIGTP